MAKFAKVLAIVKKVVVFAKSAQGKRDFALAVVFVEAAVKAFHQVA